MGRLFAFASVFGIFLLSASLSGDSVGVSSSCINAQCVVAGSSSIGSVILGLVIVAVVFLRPDQRTQIRATAVVGVWRRLGAFWIDFAVVLLAIAPLAALPLLFAEASYTGTFEWSFVRKFARSSDALFVLPGVLVTFAALYFYFFYHPLKGVQTIGEYISGFKIIAAENAVGGPLYGMRPITGFIGLCAWPVSVYFALKKEDKRFWWDTESRTRAVMICSAK